MTRHLEGGRRNESPMNTEIQASQAEAQGEYHYKVLP
jgi:hypothetical protein